MLLQKAVTHDGFIKTFDLDAFVPGRLARHDRDAAAGHTEGLGQEGDQGVVGGAVNRRRREADEDGVPPHPVNAGARSARDHTDLKTGGQSLPTSDCQLRTAANGRLQTAD